MSAMVIVIIIGVIVSLALLLLLVNLYRKPFSKWLKTKTPDTIDSLIDVLNNGIDELDGPQSLKIILVVIMALPGLDPKVVEMLRNVKNEL